MYAAAYPGSDPLLLTLAVFKSRLSHAFKNQAAMRGLYTDEMEREDDIERMNKVILWKERFASFFEKRP